jgi:cellulose synthase/poly-beta-1,6-N-acetylglucosamine synthase-like glycosyltransferase
MDDHSTDDSFVRLMKWKKMTTLPLPDCLVLKRPVHNKGGGKSGAMNAALRKIFFEREENAVIPAGKRHIIGFLDADVRCDPGILAVVADYFARPSVAALQVCKKPIISGPMSLLECCQTADYLADIFLSRQKHFRIPGRSSLRGNGMFFDGALLFHSTFVLDFQKRTYFNEETTGDDVDMTCRLKVAGLEIHYVDLVSVYEELAPTWRALLIQRARWIYGGYRRYIDFFGSLPQLWWRDPDELVEFVVLLAPLFFLAQLVPVLWLRKSFRVFLHFFALLLWGMGLMYRACSDVRIALIGFVFSLHRVMLILWATIFCVLRPTKPLEYWKTARRLDLTGNVR